MLCYHKIMTLTPEQFNKLATQEDIKIIREEMATRKDIDEVLTVADTVVKKLDNIVYQNKSAI